MRVHLKKGAVGPASAPHSTRFPQCYTLARAMGARRIYPFLGYERYDVRRDRSTHVQGGATMAAFRDPGVVSPYLQHWQMAKLFVLGGSTFPNQGSANLSPAILVFTYRTADAIVDRNLKKPGLPP